MQVVSIQLVACDGNLVQMNRQAELNTSLRSYSKAAEEHKFCFVELTNKLFRNAYILNYMVKVCVYHKLYFD